MLEFPRPGDELSVTRLDRLGRSTRDVLNLVYECEQKGAHVTVLDPHVTTRGEMGHLVITVLGMASQMERRFIKERQREEIEKAKAQGTYQGGRQRLDRGLIMRRPREDESVSSLAKALNWSSRARVLKGLFSLA